MSQNSRSIVRQFFKWLGVLIMTVSGLCTGGVLIKSTAPNPYGIAKLALLVGGVPFLLGAFFFWLGTREGKK